MELSVGVKIKEIRKGMRISQASLAKMAGIGQSTLSDIENLTMNPSAKKLLLLADALGVPLAELIGGEKEDTTEGNSKKQEMLYLLNSLSPSGQEQAMNFLRFLSKSEERDAIQKRQKK